MPCLKRMNPVKVLCAVAISAVLAGNVGAACPLTVEARFKVSGSGSGYAAIVTLFDAWDFHDIKLGVNTDFGGAWVRVAKDGIIQDFLVGISDTGFHTYTIEYDGSEARIYIDGLLKRTVSISFVDPKISLHANARAIGDTVSAQFDYLAISNAVTFLDEFDDGSIDATRWNIFQVDWMSVVEQAGELDMSGTATRQYWNSGGLAVAKPIPGMIDNLIDVVVDMDLQNGISTALDAKLNVAINALDDFNDGNNQAAGNSIEAFKNSVEAQRGNQITDAQADELINAADAILFALGC